eukprot:4600748-Pleurochrysis_carterae.AAC.3
MHPDVHGSLRVVSRCEHAYTRTRPLTPQRAHGRACMQTAECARNFALGTQARSRAHPSACKPNCSRSSAIAHARTHARTHEQNQKHKSPFTRICTHAHKHVCSDTRVRRDAPMLTHSACTCKTARARKPERKRVRTRLHTCT